MERPCACGCAKAVLGRPDKKYATTACRRAAWRARWASQWLRKRPRKSTETAQESVPDAFYGSQGHPRVAAASWRHALEVLARRSPAFYLRLAASVEQAFQPVQSAQAGKPVPLTPEAA